ncbi:MAG: DUF3021 family protein [Oscillospiraceae bacterium]|nr:DUF3021 family protein [Oscillospiraceae bacterium]
MEEIKRQWLPRALIGGIIGVILLLAFVYVFDAMPFMSHIWHFRNPFAVWGDWLLHGWGYPPSPLANLCLAFLAGAEVGVATLPFADSGRELVVRSLIHFVVTAATVGLWAVMNFGVRELDYFLVPLALVYVLVWLGRWVGWYAEVAAIREKLGLAPGPSLFHWRESLPYVGFAFLLCLVLPTVLRALDAVDVPILSVMYAWLLLPIGGFMSGLSLGRRHGFCPLYPTACTVFIVVFILTAKLYTNMADGALIPIALVCVLAGNAAGAARHKMKQKASDGI